MTKQCVFLLCCCYCCWLVAAIVVCILPTATHGWAISTTQQRQHLPPTSSSTSSQRLSTQLGATRRNLLATVVSVTAVACVGIGPSNADTTDIEKYTLKFPTLFAPLYGEASRKTMKRALGGSHNDATNNIWALEQNLELGPLQTPIRCTVVRLKDGSLWVHAPLAPTEEFFQLVESCGEQVSHVVIPTYALEHKVFAKDCLARWKDAQLWTSPGQFSFPLAGISDEFVFGKPITGVLGSSMPPPWTDEIEYASLQGGTFNIGGRPTTLCETVFYHKSSKSLIVTDALAQIPTTVPPLNDPDRLLLISKRSTADPMPEDTPYARLDGWKKTALLVSYFFPEHEEPDPHSLGVVTWTDGWEDNFDALAGRLLVPPVVRTLIYAQNPGRVKEWVDLVANWDFCQIVPAHFDAPIAAGPAEFARAFRFLEDPLIDAFPEADLARGLQPIANIALQKL